MEQLPEDQFPELVFGLVGPIGVDMEAVISALHVELKKVGYTPADIKVTELMQNIDVSVPLDETSYEKKYRSLIAYADAVRKKCNSQAALSGLVIANIRELRSSLNKTGSGNIPAFRHAYVVRQFKRPEEIEILRRTYGRKFVQVSVFLDEASRRETLMNKIREYNTEPKRKEECERAFYTLQTQLLMVGCFPDWKTRAYRHVDSLKASLPQREGGIQVFGRYSLA